MSIKELLTVIKDSPEKVSFQQVIDSIDAHYEYQPTEFSNGGSLNAAGTNAGSCKIFAFAQLNTLTESQTLACFGHYYREDVLLHPDAEDHANIRNFMVSGWAGVNFKSIALRPKVGVYSSPQNGVSRHSTENR